MSQFALSAELRCDLVRLVETRLLVQANSGGGKSWCLRRILEQTHGKVQQLVLDPEGEFASLRERYDYVLAARSGGDTVADPRSAKLLAERLLELGVSAVIDIYELKAHERVAFVQHFLEALVDAPKKLWHPALVVVDEAHVYCPQQGDAPSASAVIDLCTRGRKRGFCAVLATQRLSKLHKDAAAELNNKLIGRTGLDLDMKRAADELGFTGRDQMLKLRQLADGHFFAFGPALTLEVQAVHIGPVQTTHPKAGARLAFVAPPPTEKVRALLPKLADLPAEAAAREQTVKELKRDLADTRRQLTLAQRGQAPAPAREKVVEKRVEVPILKDAQADKLLRFGDRLVVVATDLLAFGKELATAIRTAKNGSHAPAPLRRPIHPITPRVIRASQTSARKAPAGDQPLPEGERRVLTAVAQYPEGATREQLSILTGYKRSTRDRYLQFLQQKGYVQAGELIVATADGLAALGDRFEPLPTGEALLQYWLRRLPEGERRILDVVVAGYPDAVDREAISEATGYKRSTRDRYLQFLATRRIVKSERDGVRAAGELFEVPTP